MEIDWKNELEYDMYIRLCDWNNKQSDIPIMSKVIKKVMGKNSQDALDYMLEWVTDWNNQIELYPNEKKYNKMLKMLDNASTVC